MSLLNTASGTAPRARDAPLKNAAGPNSDRKRNFRRCWVVPAANGPHRHLQGSSFRKRELLLALTCILLAKVRATLRSRSLVGSGATTAWGRT